MCCWFNKRLQTFCRMGRQLILKKKDLVTKLAAKCSQMTLQTDSVRQSSLTEICGGVSVACNRLSVSVRVCIDLHGHTQ